jgi:Tripartite tricarboxylate transporter family receptor
MLMPLPELPTIAESGCKDSEYWNWFGVVVPRKDAEGPRLLPKCAMPETFA